MSQVSPDNLIWIDLEMTGLDPDNDKIIEIATIITDSDLHILEEGPVVAIYQPESIIGSMDEWNTSHHTGSGLVKRIRESEHSVADAQTITIDFLKKWVDSGQSPMCGNSICQDRRFMARLMPGLESYFHYRNLDVSSIKELAKRWAPDVHSGVKKEGLHLALSDIRDSINELRHYRQHFFRETRKNL